ncbi:glycosyltransferase [Paraglaciecola sp.]|uniref:glycosyltransferase family 2 protein n=1 Tax=Paraglaciecola sp. TaxID=1920173 RepID=UPI00326394B1
MSVKVSLICPVYKVTKYIPDLMNSLLQGVNTEDVEIIFVDDCCPEKSIELCEKFIKDNQTIVKFTSIILRQTKNQGQAAARNVALKKAQGVYIGFIDSDDAIAPHYWETLSPYVASATADIIEFKFNEFTSTLPVTIETTTSQLPSSKMNPFYNGFFVWTRLYKKDLVKNITFPEGLIYEDIFYNIEAFAKAKTSISLSNCLVFYRKRTESTTSGRNSNYSNLLLNMINAVQSNIGLFTSKSAVVEQVVRYSVLVSLKGFTIKDPKDRRLFFQKCKVINATFTPIFKQFNKRSVTYIKFKFSKLTCVIGAMS